MNTIKPLVAKSAGEAKTYIRYVKDKIAQQLGYYKDGMAKTGQAKWLSSFTGSNSLSPYLKNGQALFTDDEAYNDKVINVMALIQMGYPVDIISYESANTDNPILIPNPVFEIIYLIDLEEKKAPQDLEKIKLLEAQLDYYNDKENKTIRNSTSTDSRRTGVDIVQSASKDFSLISALCPQFENEMDRILYESNQLSLNHILDAAMGRKKINGQEVLFNCKASAMSMLHREARSVNGKTPDPLRHIHNMILPSVIIVRDGKEEMTTLDLNSCEKVIHEADLLARIYRANELQKLGVEMERIGNGDVKIKLASDVYIDHFSKRKNDAEDLVKDNPEITKDQAILKQKKHKDPELTELEMQDDWHKQSAELELQPGDLRLTPESISNNIFGQLKGEQITRHQHELFKAQEVALSQLGAEKAIIGVDGCFSAQKLKEHYLLSIIGTGKPVEYAYNLFNEHIAVLDKEHLKFSKIEKDGKTAEYYTCHFALGLVSDISTIAKKSNQTVFEHPLSDLDIMTAMSKFEEQTGRQMTTCQVNASYGILQSKSQFIWCEGSAGSGKSFTSKLTADLYESLKTADGKPIYDMIYLASTHKAKKVLNKDLGKKDGEVYTLSQLVADLKQDKKTLKANSILMIDEAVMCGVEDVAYILKEADKSGSRIIFGGDLNQLESVSFTNPIGLIAMELDNQSKFRLETVVRQQTTGLLRLANALKNNECSKEELVEVFDEALRKGWINTADGDKEAKGKLIDDFINSSEPLENRLILTPRNDDVEYFNSAIQLKMRTSKIDAINLDLNKGKITAEDAQHSIDTLNKNVSFYTYAKNTKQAPHKYKITLDEGDPIVILKTEKLKKMNVGANGMENGDGGRIRNIQGRQFEIHFDSGKILKCDASIAQGEPGSVPNSIRLAYAGTSHTGQGATVNHCLGFVRKSEQAINKNNFYVMLSRMRTQIGIYCDESMFERMKTITAQVRRSDMWEVVANVECWKDAVKKNDVDRAKMIISYNHELNDLVRSPDHLLNADKKYAEFINKVMHNEVQKPKAYIEQKVVRISEMERLWDTERMWNIEKLWNTEKILPHKVKMIYKKFENMFERGIEKAVAIKEVAKGFIRVIPEFNTSKLDSALKAEQAEVKAPVIEVKSISLVDIQLEAIEKKQEETAKQEAEAVARKGKERQDQIDKDRRNAEFNRFKVVNTPKLVENQKIASLEQASTRAVADAKELADEMARAEQKRIAEKKAMAQKLAEYEDRRIGKMWVKYESHECRVEISSDKYIAFSTELKRIAKADEYYTPETVLQSMKNQGYSVDAIPSTFHDEFKALGITEVVQQVAIKKGFTIQ